MEAVCKMLRRRIDAGKRVVPVSCNFSRLHFIKEDFAENFEAMINKYQVPKDLIEVEIIYRICRLNAVRQGKLYITALFRNPAHTHDYSHMNLYLFVYPAGYLILKVPEALFQSFHIFTFYEKHKMTAIVSRIQLFFPVSIRILWLTIRLKWIFVTSR